MWNQRHFSRYKVVHMQKYAKVINAKNKMCQVGIGTNTEFYVSLGMELTEVEQGPDGNWYLAGHAPTEAEPTSQEQVRVLEAQTGLTRAVRELVLAENSGASEYVKTTAQEIEALAEPLRTQEAGDDAGTV